MVVGSHNGLVYGSCWTTRGSSRWQDRMPIKVRFCDNGNVKQTEVLELY